ncbi:MAG: cytochrome P450 [Candidatus Planktophila sp.]|nr:cytochrome P450 [Candidatus Planktophila sp.]
MSISADRAFDTPRPATYPVIPQAISRKNWKTQADLPGPNPLLSDWLTLTFIRDTPNFLASMQKKYGNHCSFFLSRKLFIGVFSAEAVHQVTVAQQRNFVKGVGFARMRKVLGEGLLTNEEPIHLNHRRLMQPPFHHGNLDSYVEIMHKVVIEHISKWRGKNSVELAPEMMALTLEIVSQCLFGLDSSKYTEQIAHSMEIAIDRIERTMLPGLERFDKTAISYFAAFEEAANRLADIAEEIIQSRITSNTTHTNDLLGILLQMREHISMEHIRDEVLTLILSGHETTANVLTWAFAFMSDNQESAKKLALEADAATWITNKTVPTFAELEESSKFANSILNETLRLAPPVWVSPRIALVDTTIDGVHVPAGAHVLISQYVTQRLEQYFANPHVWDPNRWQDPLFESSLPRGAYFPFLAGSRKCLGESFALAEARLILLLVAKNYRVSAKMPSAQPRTTYRAKGAVPAIISER